MFCSFITFHRRAKFPIFFQLLLLPSLPLLNGNTDPICVSQIPGIGLVGLGLPVLGGGAGLGGLAPILTGLFAIGAALAAGFAALVGIIVPPLQIANQILAIIAIALLIGRIILLFTLIKALEAK